MPALTVAVDCSESISTRRGNSANDTSTPGVSAMSLKEWPLPRARKRPLRATSSWSCSTDGGASTRSVPKVMLPAQFVARSFSPRLLRAIEVTFLRHQTASLIARCLPQAGDLGPDLVDRALTTMLWTTSCSANGRPRLIGLDGVAQARRVVVQLSARDTAYVAELACDLDEHIPIRNSGVDMWRRRKWL